MCVCVCVCVWVGGWVCHNQNFEHALLRLQDDQELVPLAASGSKSVANAFGRNKARKRRSEVSTRSGASLQSLGTLGEMSLAAWEDGQAAPDDQVNNQALKITQRIKEKLSGRDFSSRSDQRDFFSGNVKDHRVVSKEQAVSVEEQVERLMEQAQAPENLACMFVGWCAFW